jgi:hypothetical protein
MEHIKQHREGQETGPRVVDGPLERDWDTDWMQARRDWNQNDVLIK